jgi:hypothetical protein
VVGVGGLGLHPPLLRLEHPGRFIHVCDRYYAGICVFKELGVMFFNFFGKILEKLLLKIMVKILK